MHSQMSIGKKLVLCFGALMACLLALSYGALTSINGMKERFDLTADKTIRKVLGADAINTAESDMMVYQRGMLLAAFQKDASGVAASRQKFEENSSLIAKSIDDIRPLLITDEGRRLLEDMHKQHQAWLAVFGDVVRLCNEGKPEEGTTLGAQKIVPIYDEMGRQAAQLADMQKKFLEQDKADAAAQYASSRWLSLGMIAVGTGLGVLVLFIVRGITATLKHLAREMAQGAQQVASAAGQVSSSSQMLAQGASEQAASLEETSAATEEIHSMTRKNAENAQSAAQVVGDSNTRVDEANRKLEQMVASMKEITASSDKIAKIIRVIDEIAFQTNILALNAAVEAARAGDAGMGFAVVADEVRNLAQRCAQAAKDTESLIESSITSAADGQAKLDQVTAAITGITTDAGKIKTLVDEVNVGSQEQSRGFEQVSKAITQMETVTQRTAANAEESAAAGEELSAQADRLREAVRKLGGMVGGAMAEASQTHELQRGPAAHRGFASLKALGKAVAQPVTADNHAPEAVSNFPMD